MSRNLLATPLATVETVRRFALWDEFIWLGTLALLSGRAGIGKSTLLAWITARATLGQLEGDLKGQPVAVGLISAEDDLSATLKPRLTAAGANLDLVYDLSAVRVEDEKGRAYKTTPTLADDLERIAEAVTETGIRLLFVDPLISTTSGDSHKAAEVRRELDPLAQLAQDLDIAVVGVSHWVKGANTATDAMSGSHAFRDVARSVLLFAIDQDSDDRVLSVDKANYAKTLRSLAFTIDDATVPTDDGHTTSVGVARLKGDSAVTVAEIVRRANDTALGDLSGDILALVRQHPEGITAADVADELGEPVGKVRTYLGRLANSQRVQRVARGCFAPVDTPVSISQSVLSVSSVSNDDTDNTENTLTHAVTAVSSASCKVHGTPTLDGLCGRCAVGEAA